MMPPMSGTDANAAAIFEGRPVEVGCVVGPGGGGEGGGADGSTGLAMVYIHKLANELSSQLSKPAVRLIVPVSCQLSTLEKRTNRIGLDLRSGFSLFLGEAHVARQ